MNSVMLLLANGVLLTGILIALLLVSKKSPASSKDKKVKEDIQKIKNQINGDE